MDVAHAIGLLLIGSLATIGLFLLLFKFEELSEKERKEDKEKY